MSLSHRGAVQICMTELQTCVMNKWETLRFKKTSTSKTESGRCGSYSESLSTPLETGPSTRLLTSLHLSFCIWASAHDNVRCKTLSGFDDPLDHMPLISSAEQKLITVTAHVFKKNFYNFSVVWFPNGMYTQVCFCPFFFLPCFSSWIKWPVLMWRAN